MILRCHDLVEIARFRTILLGWVHVFGQNGLVDRVEIRIEPFFDSFTVMGHENSPKSSKYK